MQEYVAGFMFDDYEEHVALIKKKKPVWQEGKLNAVGGKVEKDEAPLFAMQREFKEETGINCDRWRLFCILEEEDWRVYFYYVIDSVVFDVRTTTDEEVKIYSVSDILNDKVSKVLPNLKWLIPMALSMNKGEKAYAFKEIRKPLN